MAAKHVQGPWARCRLTHILVCITWNDRLSTVNLFQHVLTAQAAQHARPAALQECGLHACIDKKGVTPVLRRLSFPAGVRALPSAPLPVTEHSLCACRPEPACKFQQQQRKWRCKLAHIAPFCASCTHVPVMLHCPCVLLWPLPTSRRALPLCACALAYRLFAPMFTPAACRAAATCLG